MISVPQYLFSWESFVDSLNSLVVNQRVIESQTGYRLRDEREIESSTRLKKHRSINDTEHLTPSVRMSGYLKQVAALLVKYQSPTVSGLRWWGSFFFSLVISGLISSGKRCRWDICWILIAPASCRNREKNRLGGAH